MNKEERDKLLATAEQLINDLAPTMQKLEAYVTECPEDTEAIDVYARLNEAYYSIPDSMPFTDPPDECCTECGDLYLPDEVLILDGKGPICRNCCTVQDVETAVKQGTLDLFDETPEEFLENWVFDGPV